MAVNLWYNSVQKRLAYNKHGIIRRPLFLHQEDGCALQAMGVTRYHKQWDLTRYLKEERCTGGKNKNSVQAVNLGIF